MLRVAARRVQNITTAASRTLTAQASSAAGRSTVNADVPGLSQNVVKVPNARPNASKDKEYKNPEYFCYHVDSFAEAELELAKYRLPVPSNKRPFNK
ncbi:NADH:ubiquinone oxidoreductase subunit V3 isoform X2 [Temnothorax americanus]|uniref:NADH:ubiquinone oxidoreductase subunit V3 isoform X2 n=1 Tax=Temnothorax americanus TaxID=1964332 RepID=UPI004067CF32